MTKLVQHINHLSPLKFAKGKSFQFLDALVMGIVNITPDSFYDGGKYLGEVNALKQAENLIAEGADIIDIGAASTRPGAEIISVESELKRVIPVLDMLMKFHPDVIISVDTFHSAVAKKCVEHGAAMVNDISAGTLDANMFKTIAQLQVPYIMMHMQGTPQNMQDAPMYDDVVNEVYTFLAERVRVAKEEGIEQIIIDPGFGFGKTVEHNFLLLQHFHRFCEMGIPVLAGLSRKSMINKVLKTKPENALTGTIALNTIALLQGANIIRVHDVKEAKQVIKLMHQYFHPDAEV